MNDSKDINSYMNTLGSKAKQAAKVLSQVSSQKKNEALIACAEVILGRKREIIEINRIDLRNAKEKGTGDALLDRLGFKRR